LQQEVAKGIMAGCATRGIGLQQNVYLREDIASSEQKQVREEAAQIRQLREKVAKRRGTSAKSSVSERAVR